jgi:hypothetical protein
LAIKRAELEARLLGALKSKLMDPARFREFCDEFTRERNRRASLLCINGSEWRPLSLFFAFRQGPWGES